METSRLWDGKTKTVVEPRISHAVLLTSAQLARGCVRLFFVLVVARALGPRQFGMYALLLALVEMLAVASRSGYGDYLTREAAKDARVGWGLGSQLTALRLGWTIALASAGLVILTLWGYPRPLISAAEWLSMRVAPRSVNEAVQGVLRGIGRYGAYLAVELTFDLALASGAVLLIVQHGGLRGAIATEIIAATAAGAASLVFAVRFRARERLHLSARQWLGKCVIFNVYAFVGNLYDRLDVVLLSRLAGDCGTGIYSAAYRPLGTIQLVPYGALYSLLPALSRNAAENDERQRLERAMVFLLTAAFAVVLATMIFAVPAVRLLLGERYADSAVALKILIWAVILRYVNYALNVRLLANGHEWVFVATSLICLGVNVLGNLVLIPIYTRRAAAVLTIVTEFALLAQNMYWLRRMVEALPRPLGWVRSSPVFAMLLVALLAGATVVPLLLIRSAGVLFFAAYLYRAGMVGGFAAAWRERSTTA